MLDHTNCSALTTVKCFCNNCIIILRVKVKRSSCVHSRSLEEAKNKTGGLITTIRKL